MKEKVRFFEFTYLPENISLDPRSLQFLNSLLILLFYPILLFVASFLLIGLLYKKRYILINGMLTKRSI